MMGLNNNKHNNIFLNQTVLITGAGGILGKSFAESFAGCGANIVLLDLDIKKIENYSKELCKKFKVKAMPVKCDISDPDNVDVKIEEIISKFGNIDVLINNAATKGKNLKSFFDSFEDYSIDVWREVMSVNIDGMFIVAQKVGRHMKINKKGSIIQISSIYGLVGPDQRVYKDSEYLGCEINTPAVYTVSKAAVVGLTKYLATYWGEYGIRVNCIAPGGVESGQNSNFISNYSERVPLGRMGKANEIAATVIFLASENASYINGQTIAVDGGLTTW
jgi:NAD(P)-dependent dehydrogenase (short-subunit alcohol dehydrogenase family)